MKRTISLVILLLLFLSMAPLPAPSEVGQSPRLGPAPALAQSGGNSGEFSEGDARLRYEYTGVDAMPPEFSDPDAPWYRTQSGTVTANRVTLSGEAFYQWSDAEVVVRLRAYLSSGYCEGATASDEWIWEPGEGEGGRRTV